MKNSSKHQNGFIQLPIIAVIVGIIVLGGIGYVFFKFQQKGQRNQISSENPVQPLDQQVAETQSQEPPSTPNYETVVPPNNLPEDVASAVINKYFSLYGLLTPAGVDKSTFVALPKSYDLAKDVFCAAGMCNFEKFTLPNGEEIILSASFGYAKDKNHVYI